GQPVVNQAGLVGTVTSVTPTASQVMLVTDRRSRRWSSFTCPK
ncbi:MAG: hypothetical protein F6K11_20460, partial [Leptolyngbya sp. SIO3F4]|nr:hypothetical protein [Leptolyngbya sp. SIO3F4]